MGEIRLFVYSSIRASTGHRPCVSILASSLRVFVGLLFASCLSSAQSAQSVSSAIRLPFLYSPICQLIGFFVFLSTQVFDLEFVKSFALHLRGLIERPQRAAFDLVVPVHLAHHEFAVRKNGHAICAELCGEFEALDQGAIFCHIVGGLPDVLAMLSQEFAFSFYANANARVPGIALGCAVDK